MSSLEEEHTEGQALPEAHDQALGEDLPMWSVMTLEDHDAWEKIHKGARGDCDVNLVAAGHPESDDSDKSTLNLVSSTGKWVKVMPWGWFRANGS